jgi:16S rRNA (uracil1498-N3)-methyltransferase
MRQFGVYERHVRIPGGFLRAGAITRATVVRLTRVYVHAALIPGSVIALPPDTALHLVKVLRARSGDEVVLFNGDGREFTGAIEAVRGARVSASVGDSRLVDRESRLSVTLVQCVPRGDRMDFIVQKATELGVVRIVPVLSQRSVVRLDRDHAESKANHWRAVAVSACEQCGRNRLPVIEAAQPLLSHLGEIVPGAGLRLVLEPESAPHNDVLAHADAARRDVEIAIGPEGGFANDELEAFRVAGFAQVGLGPRILRTETAAIAALVWLQARYGDMQ